MELVKPPSFIGTTFFVLVIYLYYQSVLYVVVNLMIMMFCVLFYLNLRASRVHVNQPQVNGTLPIRNLK